MAEFVAVSPTAEVLGDAVLSILDGMGSLRSRAVRILEQHGVHDLTPGRWYPQQGVLNSFRTIFEKIGPNTLQMIGHKIPSNAPFPPSIKSITEALSSLDAAYLMNHRGADHAGAYKYEPVSERCARIVCANPYPCEMDLGLVEGMAERFRPMDSMRVQVTHAPGDCRRKQAERCAYLVHW